MNAHIKIKALVLLGLTAWLLCFQTYHALTEHWNLFESNHHHCGHDHHHHDSIPLSAGINDSQDSEEDCEICKLISTIPSEIATFEYQIQKSSSLAEVLGNYSEGYFETFVSREFGRGPPVLA